MNIKPSRELQLVVGLATFPAAVATATVAQDSWLKWTIVVILVVGGGVAEWMIERAYSRAETAAN